MTSNVRGVDVESGASFGRTPAPPKAGSQDEGAVGHCVEDEDAASVVSGRQNSAKVDGQGTGAAFVHSSAMTMIVASERVYWYGGGISVESMLGIAVFYMIPTLAVLWALGRGPSQCLHQIILGGAIFGFVVEGVLTIVIYEDGPLPIMAALFVGWHGLLSVVGFWYLARRWLLERRRRLLVGASAAMGLYWGIWSIIYRLPEAAEDFEEAFAVMEPGQFAVYAMVVEAAFVAAHWLLGWVWPEEYAPSKNGRRGIVLLMALPLAAIAGYAAVWSLDPSESAIRALFEVMIVTQVPAGLVAFVWAARKAVRRKDQNSSSGIEQPTRDLDTMR